MALFSKKHYLFLSSWAKSELDPWGMEYLEKGAIISLAQKLKEDNPAFDLSRFLKNDYFSCFEKFRRINRD